MEDCAPTAQVDSRAITAKSLWTAYLYLHDGRAVKARNRASSEFLRTLGSRVSLSVINIYNTPSTGCDKSKHVTANHDSLVKQTPSSEVEPGTSDKMAFHTSASPSSFSTFTTSTVPSGASNSTPRRSSFRR